MIKLYGDFKNMLTDPTFDEIQTFLTSSKLDFLDVRSELNLAALLYATGKVCISAHAGIYSVCKCTGI